MGRGRNVGPDPRISSLRGEGEEGVGGMLIGDFFFFFCLFLLCRQSPKSPRGASRVRTLFF